MNSEFGLSAVDCAKSKVLYISSSEEPPMVKRSATCQSDGALAVLVALRYNVKLCLKAHHCFAALPLESDFADAKIFSMADALTLELANF